MSFFFNLLAGALGNLSKGNSDSNDLGCDWYCDECDDYLNDQPGFTTVFGTWTCTACGAINDVTEDNIIDEDDGFYNEDLDYNDIDIPFGCRACGGDYPNCRDSCPLYDD